MSFTRTELALEDCKEHLVKTSAMGTAVEFYLVQHMLVIFFAELEMVVHECVKNRVARTSDDDVIRFAESSAKRLFRSVRKSDLAELLKSFNADACAAFNGALAEEDVTRYGNAVTSRHNVAHGTGSQMTLRELEDALDASRRVILCFKQALG